MKSHYEKIDPNKYYKEFIDQDLRPDGRTLQKFRPMSINIGSIHNANGSAVVKIENTIVVCGIKAELARPMPETPDEGYLVVNVELPPLCSGHYQPGPPSDEAQVTTRFVDEVLRNSKCIDLKDLIISSDNLAWVLHLDIICLNQDGSLLDACVTAAVAAIKSLKVPHVEYKTETKEKIVDISRMKSVPVHSVPISVTSAIFEGNKILVDPTAEEESLCTGTLTVVIQVESGKTCGIRQLGTNPLSSEQLQSCIVSAQKKSELVYQLIDSALLNPER